MEEIYETVILLGLMSSRADGGAGDPGSGLNTIRRFLMPIPGLCGCGSETRAKRPGLVIWGQKKYIRTWLLHTTHHFGIKQLELPGQRNGGLARNGLGYQPGWGRSRTQELEELGPIDSSSLRNT